MFLKACVNGSRLPGEHTALPTTPAQLAADAASAAAAGVDAVHLHVKDASGADTLAAEPLAEVLTAVRRSAGALPVGVTTGAWTVPDQDDRVAAIRRWSVLPDFASVNWHEDGADDVALALLDRGIGVEAGLWTEDAVESWSRSPVRDRCLRVLIELPHGLDSAGTSTAARRMWEAVEAVNRERLPVLLHGEGSSAWDAITIAARRRLPTRVGLEDTLTLPDGRTAPDNASLIEEAKRILRSASARGSDPAG